VAAKEIIFRDFSGGLNARDAPSELADHEFPYSLNVTLDERGYLQKRLGYQPRHAVAGSGKVINLFYWAARNQVVEQIGSSLHLEGAASFKTFTTSDRAGFCEHNGNLFIAHPVDGCFIYNGTTVTVPTGAPTKASTCATWQNRVWVDDLTSPARAWKSDIGNASNFGGTAFVDLKEKDSAAITLMTGSSGLDIAGRPGLIVCKADSAYRINDPSTGSFQTIDTSIGAGSNIAGVSAYGRVYTISAKGIYSTDGIQPFKEESRLIETFFQKLQMNQDRPDLLCAGRYADRLFFSVPRYGETNNSTEFELNPQDGWITMHDKAASAYASISRYQTDMVFGSPTVNGKVYNSHVGGTDDGTAITSAFQSRWVEPNFGKKVRIRQIRYTGLGVFTSQVMKNYDEADVMRTIPVEIANPGFLYDDPSSVYDAPGVIYSTPEHQDVAAYWSVGVCKALAFTVSETSSITKLKRNVLGGVNNPEMGAWTLSSVILQSLDLGNV